jgi:hypothetical protein
MHRFKLALTSSFWAANFMATDSTGMSGAAVGDQLGVTQAGRSMEIVSL